MGAAAYNRGSRALAEQILREAGRWRDPPTPKPRPPTWGDKTRARALERARRILRSSRRYGLPVDLERLAGAVALGDRMSEAVATEAARLALDEEAAAAQVAPQHDKP